MSAPVVKLLVVGEDIEHRYAVLQWPDGSQIAVHYPSSAGAPSSNGWDEHTTCFAWCVSVNRVPWLFAYDTI